MLWGTALSLHSLRPTLGVQVEFVGFGPRRSVNQRQMPETVVTSLIGVHSGMGVTALRGRLVRSYLSFVYE